MRVLRLEEQDLQTTRISDDSKRKKTGERDSESKMKRKKEGDSREIKTNKIRGEDKKKSGDSEKLPKSNEKRKKIVEGK